MKKLAIGLVLFAAATAQAQYPHHNHRGGGWGWVAPVIVGGVVGYEVARSQQPVIIQQPPQTIIVPSPAPVGYHWQQMVNPQTGQYQLALVPN